MTDLLVSEVFGPTIQGEGRSIGRPAMFLRMVNCNLKCTWCDTKYTWDWTNHSKESETHPIDVDILTETIADAWLDFNPTNRLLIITGGEPLIQYRQLYPLVFSLWSRRWSIEIETAGTIIPDRKFSDCVRYNVSPKLGNSGNSSDTRLKIDVLKGLNKRQSTVFKFVLVNPPDIEEVDYIVNEAGIDPHKIYLMPEGVINSDLDRRLDWIIPMAIERTYCITDRFHIRLWGNKRGR